MKTKRKVLVGLVLSLMLINVFLGVNSSKVDIDFKTCSNVAMASSETPPGSGDPIIEPTGIVDWLKEIFGL